MITKNRQLFATGLFLLDGVVIAASWLAAYWLRFHGLGVPSPLGVPPIGPYLWFGAVLTPVALMILRSLHLYRSTRPGRLSRSAAPTRSAASSPVPTMSTCRRFLRYVLIVGTGELAADLERK